MERTRDLEERIRSLDGVIEAAIFGDEAGRPIEIQVWTQSGVSEREVRAGISSILASQGEMQSNERLYIFELSGQRLDRESVSPLGPLPRTPLRDESAEPAAPDPIPGTETEVPSGGWSPAAASPGPSGDSTRRPRIGKISLTSSESKSHAEVSLSLSEREAEGTGEGPRTPYALRVTAATTLEAAQRLLGREDIFALRGVSLVEVMEERIVVVIVESSLGENLSLLGAVLVGTSQVYEATVKATLDAVNRQLEGAL